jgi:hypothetical protein
MSCCHKSVPAHPTSTVTAPPCQKALVASPDTVPVVVVPQVDHAVVFAPVPVADLNPPFAAQLVPAPHADPPPVDRIVVLCHFVI